MSPKGNVNLFVRVRKTEVDETDEVGEGGGAGRAPRGGCRGG